MPFRSAASMVAVTIVVVAACLPWEPLVATSYYEYVVHLAFAHGWQHGTQIASTYGPWGFVGLSVFHPDTFGWMLGLEALLYGITIFALWHFVDASTSPWLRAVWICLILFPTSMTPAPEWAAILFLGYVHALLLAGDALVPDLATGRVTERISLTVLALFALMKLSFLPLFAVAVAVRCFRAAGWRERLTSLALAGGALVGWWILAGQSPCGLPAFLAAAVEVISGYKTSMALWGQTAPQWYRTFGVVAVAVPLVVLRASRPWWWRLPPLGLVLLCVAQIFLQGFVRLDFPHVGASLLCLCGAVPLLATLGSRRLPLAVATGIAVDLLVAGGLRHGGLGLVDRDRPTVEARALIRLAREGTTVLDSRRRALLGGLRANALLDVGAKQADVQSADFGVVEANDLGLRLRPTISSYGAYTPALSQLNAAFLEDPSGPDVVLVGGPGGIDGRFPTLSDSRSFLSLLTHFTYRSDAANLAVFARRPPRSYRLRPLTSTSVSLGDVVPVPPAAVVWATIAVDPTPTGRLLGALYKAPPLYLEAQMANGARAVHRIDTAASGGFLLSPYLSNRTAMVTFYSGGPPSKAMTVATIRVGDASLPGSPARRFYREPVRIELFAVDVGG